MLTFNNQRQKSQQHTLHFLTDDKLHMNKLTLKLLRKEKVYLWPSYTCIQIYIVLEVFCVNNNDYIFNNLINKSVILLHIFQHEYWNFNYNWVLYKFIEKTIRKIWRTLFDIGKFRVAFQLTYCILNSILIILHWLRVKKYTVKTTVFCCIKLL